MFPLVFHGSNKMSLWDASHNYVASYSVWIYSYVCGITLSLRIIYKYNNVYNTLNNTKAVTSTVATVLRDFSTECYPMYICAYYASIILGIMGR